MTYDPELIRRLGAAVADPERVEPSLGRGRRLLRLSCQPSMWGASYAWVIVVGVAHRPELPAIVREVRVAEGQLRVRDAEIAPATAASWCREAAAIGVPLVGVEEHMGCDGTTFELQAASGFSAVSLSWWCEGPMEWRPLTTWARRLMSRMHDLAAPGEQLDAELYL